MKSKGRILDVNFGRNRKPRLLIEIDEEPGEIPEGDIDIECKPHKEKRSLDANAYYWVLVNQIAKVLRGQGDPVSNAEIHVMLLRRYGMFEIDEEGAAKWVVLPEGQKPPEGVYLMETGHTVKMKNKKGDVTGIVYIRLRGSHTYNTAEMAALIDGAIEDAKVLGIDTITPDEKAKMLAQWEKKYEKTHQEHNSA